MGSALSLRQDQDGVGLRPLVRQARDANQTRRLMSLTLITDGGSRADAVRLFSVTVQIVRDWVVRLNARSPDGLINGKAPGGRTKLNDTNRQARAKIVERGPIPAVDGVVRWRRRELVQWIFEGFRVSMNDTTVGRELKAPGFAKISARPRHDAQNGVGGEAFKRILQSRLQTSGPNARPARILKS